MHLFARLACCAALMVLTCGSVCADDVPRFEVRRFAVEGNSLVSTAEADRLLAPFAGKSRDFGDLQQAVEALEQAYRSRGFHAVRVVLPEQELTGGVVVLRVFETRVAGVVVEGNRHFSEENIRASVPSLQVGAPPNIDRISSHIRVANENPAKKVQMVLQGGEREDAVNAVLKVADQKPWKVGISLDDTGTDQTGDLRLGFLAQHANLFDRDHLLTLQYTTSPDHIDKVSIYSLGYRIPLYGWRGSLDLYGGYSDVDSGTVQSGILSLNVSGQGTFAGIRYNQNLSRSGSYEHRVMFGFDYRRFESTINFAGAPLGTVTEVHPIGLGYAGQLGLSGGGSLDGWLALSQNVPGGEKGDTTAFRKVRTDAVDDYTLLRAGGAALYPFAAEWQGRFSVIGQYTWLPLIPGEQFGMGGQNSVRGFEEREFSDDFGMTGSVEIYTPNLVKGWDLKSIQLRGLAFYDAGILGRNKAQPGEPKERVAASTGLGLRLFADQYLSASTDYAFVVNSEGRRSTGSGRWHFSVHITF